jgi:hypothetical protein
MNRKPKPIHYTEMRKELDIARIRRQTVNIRCWKLSTGEILEYKGWFVRGSHWHGGTHRLQNPANGQVREVRDICIFEFMGREVYL